MTRPLRNIPDTPAPPETRLRTPPYLQRDPYAH